MLAAFSHNGTQLLPSSSSLADRSVTSPRFSGESYLALPTLTNAYQDLQLSLDFRPTAADGVLLLTGESADMTGDYLALLIRDGHVELRYDSRTNRLGSRLLTAHLPRLFSTSSKTGLTFLRLALIANFRSKLRLIRQTIS